jgi:hypothetical protein
MQVPLTAYAEDCSFTGEVAITGDRLSDFLASTAEFEVLILRDDLCLVLAGEPRGREDLRIWTRTYPVVARVGPYAVRGYVHAPPTIDPLKLPSRRQIVAVTSATIAYTEAGREVEIQAETVLMNSTWIEALQTATAEDLDAAALQDDEPAASEPSERLGP